MVLKRSVGKIFRRTILSRKPPNGGVDVAANTRNVKYQERSCSPLTSNNLLGIAFIFTRSVKTMNKNNDKINHTKVDEKSTLETTPKGERPKQRRTIAPTMHVRHYYADWRDYESIPSPNQADETE